MKKGLLLVVVMLATIAVKAQDIYVGGSFNWFPLRILIRRKQINKLGKGVLKSREFPFFMYNLYKLRTC